MCREIYRWLPEPDTHGWYEKPFRIVVVAVLSLYVGAVHGRSRSRWRVPLELTCCVFEYAAVDANVLGPRGYPPNGTVLVAEPFGCPWPFSPEKHLWTSTGQRGIIALKTGRRLHGDILNEMRNRVVAPVDVAFVRVDAATGGMGLAYPDLPADNIHTVFTEWTQARIPRRPLQAVIVDERTVAFARCEGDVTDGWKSRIAFLDPRGGPLPPRMGICCDGIRSSLTGDALLSYSHDTRCFYACCGALGLPRIVQQSGAFLFTPSCTVGVWQAPFANLDSVRDDALPCPEERCTGCVVAAVSQTCLGIGVMSDGNVAVLQECLLKTMDRSAFIVKVFDGVTLRHIETRTHPQRGGPTLRFSSELDVSIVVRFDGNGAFLVFVPNLVTDDDDYGGDAGSLYRIDCFTGMVARHRIDCFAGTVARHRGECSHCFFAEERDATTERRGSRSRPREPPPNFVDMNVLSDGSLLLVEERCVSVWDEGRMKPWMEASLWRATW
jgi:hypothetical protein